MLMPWYLPLSLGVGLLLTRTAREYRKQHGWSRASRNAWWAVFFGWVPLVAWIVNNLWPQY